MGVTLLNMACTTVLQDNNVLRRQMGTPYLMFALMI